MSNRSLFECKFDFETDWVLKFFSFGYSLYIAIYIGDMMDNTIRRGMYCIITSSWVNKPHFVNGQWLRIGVYYNMVASFYAVLVSYTIVLCGEDPLDLVLNSVA